MSGVSTTAAITEVAISCNSEENDLLRDAAASLNLRLEVFLLAGFAGVLSRLLWQETVSLVSLSPVSSSAPVSDVPQLVTFDWEGSRPFRAGLETMRTEGISAADISTFAGVSYQFLPSNIPSASTSRSSSEAGPALCLTVQEQDSGQLIASLSSHSERWTESTLAGWLKSLKGLWLAAAGDPDVPLRQLPLLEETDLLDFYHRLNRTAADYPSHVCAHDLIALQAQRTPQAIATVFGSRRLTYSELDEQSTRRAHQLIALGAGPNRPVAICMERSELLPVALLAVLKSGSCYVPLDPQHPRQRLTSILDECLPVAILSDTSVAPSFETGFNPVACPVIRMDSALPSTEPVNTGLPAVSPDDLAYIIYTSGTTGKPKGVKIVHRALTNLLESIRREPGVKASDRWLAVATISFDIATMDMLLPLFAGATLFVAGRHAGGDPFQLASLLAENDITVLQATPFTWRLLVSSEWTGKRGLKMIAGGEALPRDLANDLIALGGELWNCYGPTETTIYSSVVRIKAEDGIVPIGPPLANTSFYIMDEAGRPVPEGVPGELYIGGVGVSQGYLDRPELTAERFVPDLLSTEPGAQCFRTGDLVRVLSVHELEFMGRLDHQVKLRGYRIELGEVEAVLRTHPAIANAAVILREDTPGEPRLVAYITLSQNPQPSSEPLAVALRAHTARILPEYMLPSRIVTLDTLPLTGSGKVDRRALPLPESMPESKNETTRPIAAGVAPANDLEAQLLQIFREVLNEKSLGVTDSFFDYGGYSLLTARLFSRIHRTLDQKLPISLLFDAPTPRALAEIIQKGGPLPMVVPIRTTGRAAPLFVIHSYLIYAVLLEAIEEERPIYGVRELDTERKRVSLEERATLYAGEIAKTYPDGPLCLAGWCAAGSLTVEVARQLRDDGRMVAMVALFDSERPGYQPHTDDGSSLLMAKVAGSFKYHSDCMRELNLRGKLGYLLDQGLRRWEDAVEIFSFRHRKTFNWLQRYASFLLPEALQYGSVGVTPDELQPRTQQFYPGKIVLFRASDVAQIAGSEPSLGWNTVARGGVHVEFAPGDHESMFRHPHLPKFGGILRRVLREGEAALGISS